MQVRASAVAGMFYPGEPSHLEQLLERFFSGKTGRSGVKGIVSPHAGYVYSGEIAATAFASISPQFSGTFVVIGPSHRGYNTCVSEIPWETPLGVVDNDTELVRAMNIDVDEVSQREEHSIEVQVPFIKYRFPRARIAPVMMGSQNPDDAQELAGQVLAAARRTRREIVPVASSDFSHYVPAESARAKDLYAIEALKNLDVPEFYRRIRERDVSACGYGPIAAVALVCGEMGARRGELLKYATSGDKTGDDREVVGYAAIAVI
ncbi:MAG: AmmeMemoRadiSam system protein B [Methanoregulaceae archaeon]|nr:AmmeMemoRadiSam system protein B [Methanoregulaceae archaeon]